jgi:hypothetical protein
MVAGVDEQLQSLETADRALDDDEKVPLRFERNRGCGFLGVRRPAVRRGVRRSAHNCGNVAGGPGISAPANGTYRHARDDDWQHDTRGWTESSHEGHAW